MKGQFTMTTDLINDYPLQLLHRDHTQFWLAGGQGNTPTIHDGQLRLSTGEKLYKFPYHLDIVDRDLRSLTRKINLLNDQLWNIWFQPTSISLVETEKETVLYYYVYGFVFDNTGTTEGNLGEFNIVLDNHPDVAEVTYNTDVIHSTDYVDRFGTRNHVYSHQLEQNIRQEFKLFVDKSNELINK